MIGSSDLTSTWWRGSVFFYDTIEDVNKHSYKNYFVAESTVSDGKFLDDDLVSY